MVAAKNGYDYLVSNDAIAQLVAEAKAGLSAAIDEYVALLCDYQSQKVALSDDDKLAYMDGVGSSIDALNEKLSATFAINRRFEVIAKKPAYLGKVDTINIAGQFDTEYCMPSAEVRVNNRCEATEIRQSNGVHPSHSGYLQIGDAALRHFAARLSEK